MKEERKLNTAALRLEFITDSDDEADDEVEEPVLCELAMTERNLRLPITFRSKRIEKGWRKLFSYGGAPLPWRVCTSIQKW